MNSTMVSAILASALALSAPAALAAKTALGDAKGTPETATPNFATADRDNSGMLDRIEARAMPAVTAHFDAIDADKDGKVSRDEIQVYERFAKKDSNADGALDRSEAKGWWIVSRNFDAMDTDSGETVSLAEIGAYLSARKLHFVTAK